MHSMWDIYDVEAQMGFKKHHGLDAHKTYSSREIDQDLIMAFVS